MPSWTLKVVVAPGSSVIVRVSAVQLTQKPSPLKRGVSVVSPQRALTDPVSSVPSWAGMVAIGELAVIVRVVGSAPVFVIEITLTAVLLYVMNFLCETLRPVAAWV